MPQEVDGFLAELSVCVKGEWYQIWVVAVFASLVEFSPSRWVGVGWAGVVENEVLC